MNNITYLTGDATQPQGEGIKIIVHICNDIGGWGKGFVLALSKRWQQPEQAYRQWAKQSSHTTSTNQQPSNIPFELGQVQLVQVESDIYVANMIGQHNIKTSKQGVPPIRYEAVQQCLQQVAKMAETLNASVHMPRIGCGLAGGHWDKIEPIIQQTLLTNNIKTVVYDF